MSDFKHPHPSNAFEAKPLQMTKTPSLFFFILFTPLFFTPFSSASRHLLHQPFFPVTSTSPPPSPHHHKKHPPPPPHEKHLFSSSSNPPPHLNPFFPSSHPPPPPPLLSTFPANISTLLFPTHKPPSKPHKLIIITASIISSITLLSLFTVFIIYIRKSQYGHRFSPADDTKSTRSDALQLFNATPSDGSLKHKQQPPKYTSSHTSSEFLYLGTLVNSRSGGLDQSSISGGITGVLELPSSSRNSQYHKQGSPELRPLPPLPKFPSYKSSEQLCLTRQDFDGDDNENDEFYSPRGSSGRKHSPVRVSASIIKDYDVDQIDKRSIDGSGLNSGSPTNSVDSLKDCSGTSVPHASLDKQKSVSKRLFPTRPPPPPPPRPQFSETMTTMSPPDRDSEKKEEAC